MDFLGNNKVKGISAAMCCVIVQVFEDVLVKRGEPPESLIFYKIFLNLFQSTVQIMYAQISLMFLILMLLRKQILSRVRAMHMIVN